LRHFHRLFLILSILDYSAGGASAAANIGVPDRLFKLGKWRSETGKYGFIKGNFDERLSVSKHLNYVYINIKVWLFVCVFWIIRHQIFLLPVI